MADKDFTIRNGILKKYTGPGGDVVIPDSVTSIGEEAFYKCESLTSITIPDSVTRIGDYAFSECSNLTSIAIPGSVVHIGDGTFYYCTNLTSITIPDGVTSIGEETFSCCTSLASITIPGNVTSIGHQAFCCCKSFTGIIIPDSVTSIGCEAFRDCESLASITIPDSVTKFYDRVFLGCRALADKNGFVIVRNVLYAYYGEETDVTIPDGVMFIGGNAFAENSWDNSHLTQVTIPDGVKGIGRYAFYDCKNLSSIIIPTSVTSIGEGAFELCLNLTNITIPDGVTSIDYAAFRNCSNLTSITIPDSVTSVDKWAFDSSGLCFAVMSKKVFGRWNPHSCSMGISVKDRSGFHYYAYSTKNYDNNLQDFVRPKKWIAYDLELINNGPQYKYKLPARLCGMLGRLVDPVDLAEDIREQYLAFLIKNAKKLVALAEQGSVPDIVQQMFALGIVNKSNEKAIKKLLAASANPVIAAFASEQAAAVSEKAPEKEVPANPLAALYAQKFAEAGGEKAIRDMKLLGSSMPEVLLKDGTPAPKDLFRFILVSYGRLNSEHLRFIPEADEAASLLAYDSLCSAMEKVSGDLNVPDYPALLPMLCRFGSPAQIKRLTESYRDWEDWARYGAKGRHAQEKFCDALVLSDSKTAVLFLEKNFDLMRFAAIRSITVADVYEKFLFDFGFDDRGVRSFDLGSTVIEATLNENLSLSLRNTVTGKVVRSIPKKNVDPAVQKKAADELDDMRQSLKKAVKVKQDQLRVDYLEATAVSSEEWKTRYFGNIFLNRVARLVVWEQEGNTFLLAGDGAVAADGSSYIITDKPIRLAHPMEMEPEDIAAWQKYFTSHGLKQPFEQVWEPVVDPSIIKKDRYADCGIRTVYLKNQERRGITMNWYESYYHESHRLDIEGFDVTARPMERDDKDDRHSYLEITSLTYGKWNRRTNMVIAYLDRITVYGRILKDDVSVAEYLDSFTLAQITEFIKLASENNCTNVTALLLEHQNEHFSDFDPMDEFTLE